jgi:hypothetical protein
MTKIVLNDIASLTNEQSALTLLNSNSSIIETASDNFLSRDGAVPNQMNADLDMNSNDILNLPFPTNPNSPLRLSDLTSFVSSGNFPPDAEFVAYTPTGLTARTVESKLSDFLNIKDFGAVSGTNSSTAINAAILAASNLGGGTVYVPAGTYLIDDTVILRSRVILKGSGIDATKFVAINSLNKDMFQTLNTSTLFGGVTTGGEKWWGITDCTIDGNKANLASGNGIKTYSRSYVLNNVKIHDCKEKGLYSQWSELGSAFEDDNTDAFMETYVSNLRINNCGGEGIYFDGPHDSHFDNCIVALNSLTSLGTLSGIFVGSRAGGTRFTSCHSWGDTQKYAFQIQAHTSHYNGCMADDATTALVAIEADNVTWIGAVSIGGFISDPASANDKNLKGFLIGTASHTTFYPNIVTNVINCPNGTVDFTFAGNLGGNVQIVGYIDSLIQTVTTGQNTFGFVGTLPSSYNIDLRISGVGNAASVHQIADVVHTADGTASFPAYSFINELNSGLYRVTSNQIAMSLGGAQRHLWTSAGNFQSQGSTADEIRSCYRADQFGPSLYLEKSRNATVGSHTVVQSGDILGTVIFQGSDGTNMEQAAQIRCEVDTTPGNNDMPGRIIFATTPDGSTVVTEAMRIDNAQKVIFNADRSVRFNNQTSAAGANTGTLTNSPTTGNPGHWLKINIAGTNYAIPCWLG